MKPTNDRVRGDKGPLEGTRGHRGATVLFLSMAPDKGMPDDHPTQQRKAYQQRTLREAFHNLEDRGCIPAASRVYARWVTTREAWAGLCLNN